jgi:phage I-like protein
VPQDDSINGKLISFAITNGARAAKDLPSRLKLLSWGRNETVKGPVTVGARTVRELAANQAKVGFDKIALDYNHQTVPSSPNYQRDPVQVAAYGTPEVVEGDGLYLNISDWTPSGRENAANYHDLSPTPQLDGNGEVIFLHSVALCRQGAVDGLSFYTASFTHPESLKPHSTTHKPTKTMDYRSALIELLKKLGVTLPDNPSDAEIGDAAGKYKPGASDDTTTLSVELDKRLKALEAGHESSERDSLIALATSQGKVIPLTVDQIKTIPLTVLGQIVENVKPTVPLESRGKQPVAGAEDRGKVVALSAEDKQVIKTLGISEADFIKANPELAAVATV